MKIQKLHETNKIITKNFDIIFEIAEQEIKFQRQKLKEYESKQIVADQTIKEKGKEIEKLKLAAQKDKETLESLKNQLILSRNENENLKDEKAKIKAKFDALNSESLKIKQELTTSLAIIDEDKKKNTDLLGKSQLLNEEKSSLEQSKTSLERKCETLSASFTEKAEKVTELQEILEKEREEKTTMSLKLRIEQKRETWDEEKKLALAKLERENQSMTKELQKMKAARKYSTQDDVDRKIRELEAEGKQTKSSQKKLEGEIERYKLKDKELSNSINILKKELENKTEEYIAR